ncbi:MAG: DNA recombination protein RmuC [Sphingobacteriia bacterium]|nr:DNA recombination protein RmuC [Sphingobacteriia bacterium]
MELSIIIVNAISLFLLFSGLIYLVIKNNKFKTALNNELINKAQAATLLDILNKENEQYKALLEELKESNNFLDKEIDLMRFKLQENENKLREWQELKKESMEHAKAAIFEVGKSLSEQLIANHKQEQTSIQETNQKFIQETTNKIHEEFLSVVKTVASLSDQVKTSTTSVDFIKNALLNPAGAGALAETTLENILRSLGLIHGIDFHMQFSIDAGDSRLRPDAVVFLPGNNVIVIDSKASKFFMEFGNENVEEFFENKLSQSMGLHLKSLSQKDYKEAIRKFLNSLNSNFKASQISVLMFIPSETALERVQKVDRSFMTKAWESDIFPIGPAGLVNILSHAKFVISETKKAGYADAILEEVTKLVSALSVLQDHAKKLGNSLKSAATAYDKMAGSFNANLLPKLNRIENYGITNKNKIEYLDRYQIINQDKQQELEIENLSNDNLTKEKVELLEE